MIEEKDIKAIGKFQKTHALKGELNAILDIDSEYVSEGNAVVVDIDGIFVPFFASSVRPKGSTSYLIKLEGIDSEYDAKDFVNKTIYGIKSELVSFLELDGDDVYEEDDFSGYGVFDDSSKEMIGVVSRVDSSTENLLFVVDTPEGDEVFIPVVDDFIQEINDEDKVIKMSLPDGLIDLSKKNKDK